MLQIIFHLLVPTPISFIDRHTHTVGHFVCIHNNPTFIIPGSPANRLNERSFGTQKAFLIRIENSNKRDLREIKPFTE